MPYVRVSLLKGRSPAYLQALSGNIHQALVDVFDVPPDDCFQLIHQHEPETLIFDRHYLSGPRTDQFVLISITAGKPRNTATKQALYHRLATLLEQSPGIPPADVMVVIQTTGLDDWSFGLGVASMLKE